MRTVCLLLLLLCAPPRPCLAEEPSDAQAAKDATIIQALMRLKNIDVNANPKLKAVISRQLGRVKGTPEFLELVKRFRVREGNEELLRMTLDKPEDNTGVTAASLLLELEGSQLLHKALRGREDENSIAAIKALGLVGNPAAIKLLGPLVTDESFSASRRNEAVAAIGKNRVGEKLLMQLVSTRQLPTELEFATANALFDSDDERMRSEAAKYLKLPQTADAKPLPPVSQLAKRRGAAARGASLFANKATCIKCHKVRSEGKQVGPDLSEIGDKLSREAMFVAILNPSAAISHNYETYTVFLDNGNVANGVLVSQTDDSITINTAEAIMKVIKRDNIDELIKKNISLMPADMQRLISTEELVDVVEYLVTLRKGAGAEKK